MGAAVAVVLMLALTAAAAALDGGEMEAGGQPGPGGQAGAGGQPGPGGQAGAGGQPGPGARPDAPLCPAASRCRMVPVTGVNEYVYYVDDGKLIVDFTDGVYFGVRCANVSLDSGALPRFDGERRVARATLLGCAPPRSYGRALAALRVAPLERLTLRRVAAPLEAAALAGLAVPALSVEAARAGVGFLGGLGALRRLALEDVRLPPGELARLPRGLRALALRRCGRAAQPVALPAAVLRALPQLVELVVVDEWAASVAAEAAPALEALVLAAPGAAPPAAPRLRRVALWHWAAERPGPWAACDALLALELVRAAARALPAGWLARCGRLRSLLLAGAPLAALPAGLLAGVPGLREFNVTACRLAALPYDLFYGTPDLLAINLSDNRLESLPSGLFTHSSRLKVLDLSGNRLTAAVAPHVAAARGLERLALGRNPLGDLCPRGSLAALVPARSELHELTALVELRIERAGLPALCSDWRSDLQQLRLLDLSDNNITHLFFSELEMVRASPDGSVDLRGNPLEVLEYSREDYRRLAASRRPPAARVRLPPAQRCDCRAYWAALALRARPDHVAWAPRCPPPADLVCALPCAPCACDWRPDERRGSVARAHCAALRLAALPALPPLPAAAWRVLAPHNRLTALPATLPASLLELDLRNNSIGRAEAARARSLLRGGTVLRLAANPLHCDCAARPLLAALRDHRAQVDYSELRCRSGETVSAAGAACDAGAGGAAWGAALGGGALLGGALLLLVLPALRRRLRGGPGAGGPAEEERRYDVFVSFAHADCAFVSGALVPRLERAGLRVCVHYRDWAPGEWIPAQIAASVRASHRTLALVTRHFVRSGWARAEFREAQACRRLLVVLDEPPPALPPALARHLRGTTYLRRADPAFWAKLLRALPARPAARPAGVSPPPDPPLDPPLDPLSSPPAL